MSAAIDRSAEPLHEAVSLDAIRSGAARHFTVSAGAKAGTQLLRLATMLVLARLLAPADFGVLAMVMSAIGVAELFRDLGLSQATVRAESVTHGQINTLFWINAALGAALAALCVLASRWLPALLSDARVSGVAAAMGSTFFVNALASQHMALLRRQLRFSTIARINMVAAVAGSVTALAFAALGAAYWALVAAAIVTSVANAVGAWIGSGWRPGAPAFDAQARPMISFGGYLVGFGFLTYLAQNAHLALIGRLFGAGATGLYLRASTLITQPLSYALDPLRLILPASLSRLQNDERGFADHYLATLAPLVMAAAPFSAWLIVTAADVVHVLFGSRWHDSAPVLAWLAIGTVPQVISNTSGWLFLSRGDAHRMMRWGAAGWTVVLLAMLCGLAWGTVGVAAMYSLSMFLIVAPCMAYACEGTQIGLRDIWAATWRPLAAAALAGIPLLVLYRVGAGWPVVARLAAGSAAFGAAYLALLAFAFGERERLLGLARLARARVAKKP